MKLEDVILRGTRASQPASATTPAGTIYYVTDENVTERNKDDQSAWEDISDAGSTYTDENAQDAVGGILDDGGDIDFTYDDATPKITAAVKSDSVTYAKIQNVSATSRVLGRKTAGAGDIEELTLSELLDFISSAAQGDILYRDASAWARLAAGTDGYYLKTQGAGANPVWAAVSASGGDLTLVEHKTVTANSTTVTFSSLDGNTDGEYLLVIKIINNSGATPLYYLRPNAATTNFRSQRSYTIGGTASGNLSTTELTLGFCNATSTLLAGSYVIVPRKSAHSIAQPLLVTGKWMNDDGTNVYDGTMSGRWNETSTNVTSFDVVCASANGIGDGSELWLYKYGQ